jgi:UPF0176 protein
MTTSVPPAPAPIQVAALYRFTRFDDCAGLRASLAGVCNEHGIRGTLLLANEGINGTIAGAPDKLAAVLRHIRALPGCAEMDVKLSTASAMPFHRMKVRIKREIVTMGVPDIDPRSGTGTLVEPRDWNVLISAPGTIVVDTRNDYEVAIGSFAGAIDPQTASFSEFPDWFRRERARLFAAGTPPRVAMFCTGGIRCEKSTAFLKSEGIDQVYHLKGGILKYLEETPAADSLWQGECFVFDERVSVGHGLAEGSHSLCRACRRPLNAQDRASPLYVEGESCPQCHACRTDAQRAAYRERHRHVALAAARGDVHVGVRNAEPGDDTDD